VPELSEGAAALPAPLVVSANLTAPIRDYVLWWIRNPDPTGAFAAKTRWRRWLPGALVIRAMLAAGYDGIVYKIDAVPMGHIFFQRHGADIHVFSAGVSEPYEGRKYSLVMFLDCVAYAASLPEISRVRIGRAANQLTRHVLQLVDERKDQLGWRVTPDAWVTFR
jgi:hypothetical protein